MNWSHSQGQLLLPLIIECIKNDATACCLFQYFIIHSKHVCLIFFLILNYVRISPIMSLNCSCFKSNSCFAFPICLKNIFISSQLNICSNKELIRCCYLATAIILWAGCEILKCSYRSVFGYTSAVVCAREVKGKRAGRSSQPCKLKFCKCGMRIPTYLRDEMVSGEGRCHTSNSQIQAVTTLCLILNRDTWSGRTRFDRGRPSWEMA